MPRRRARWWAPAVAAALLGPPAAAQPAREDTVGDADIHRVGQWMRALSGGPTADAAKYLELLDRLRKEHPNLARDIDRLRQQSPNPSPDQYRQLAERLAGRQDVQNDPRLLEQLRQFSEQTGGRPNVPPNRLPASPGGEPVKPWRSAPVRPDTPPPVPPVPSPVGPLPAVPPEGRTPAPPGGEPPSAATTRPPPTDSRYQVPPIDPTKFSLPNARQQQRQEQQAAVANWWEKNVGPLDESPALRDLLTSFVAGQGGDGGESGLAKLLGGESGEGLGHLPDIKAGGRDWKLPDFNLGGWKWGGGAPSVPDGFSAPQVGSAPPVGSFGSVEGSWTPVAVLGVVAVGSLLLWWLWPKLKGRLAAAGPAADRGLGPWPVDPRTVADRAALVTAFEYLSVLRCGDGARVWNHVTIADDLRRAAADSDDPAGRLAGLYATARYAPADEPFPPPALAEARRHLCRLAGVGQV